MRDYARIAPTFWTGKTGKAIKAKGADATVVAMYLMTSPHANMLGLYYQPTLYMAHETGLGIEGASKGLAACIEVGFCSFDEASEMVWVHEMASYQIADELKADDKRCKGIQKDYLALPDNPFLGAFFDRYRAAFHLETRRATEGASEPLPSQEKEKEQEKEQEFKGADAPLPTGDLSAVASNVLTLESPRGVPPCPLRQLVALFVAKVPELPKPRLELFEQSAGGEAMRQRWKWLLTASREDGSRYATSTTEGVEWFGRFFDQVAASDFLTGRNDRWKGCSLAWLMKRENFAKVIEGGYPNTRAVAA